MKEDTFQKLQQDVNQNDSKSRSCRSLDCICYLIIRVLRKLYKCNNSHWISIFSECTQ